MALVKFYRGEYAKYAKDTMADGIYFAQDKQLIIMNGIEYGGVNMSQFEGFIKDVDVDGQTLSFKKDVDGEWVDVSIKLLEAADNSIELGTITKEGVSDGSTIKVKAVYDENADGDGLKLTNSGITVVLDKTRERLATIEGDATVDGSIKKALKDAKDYTDDEIKKLDVTDSVSSGTFVTAVSETDGKISVSRATISSSDKTITVSADTAGAMDLKANIDGVTILADKDTGKLSVASAALVQYIGSDAIKVSDVKDEKKTISLEINSNDKVLTQDANGLLTNITMSYDKDSKEIKLFGKDSTTAISTIDASDFVKDGMLAGESVFMATAETQSVTIEKQTKDFSGLTIGNHYIVFLFKIDGKTVSYSWDILDATTIVDVYKAGNGLELSSDKHTFSVKKDTTSTDSEDFLSVSESGVKVSGIQDAIDKAASASTTVVIAKDKDKHIAVTSTTDTEDGHKTYTIESVDTASDTELKAEIAARKAVDGQTGQTYAAISNANYISGATSLNDADVKLDSALKAESDRAIAAEDKIESNVGLAADGSHVKTSGNYTSGATTVVGEIDALDTQVKKNADDIAAINETIDNLDVNAIGGEGKVITTVSQENGKIAATAIELKAANVAASEISGSKETVAVSGTTVEAQIQSLGKSVKSNEILLTWIEA